MDKEADRSQSGELEQTQARTGWAVYFDPDETLLWDGAPGRGIKLELHMLGQSAFGLIFFGFALFWIIMATNIVGAGGPAQLFPLFGLPFLAIGAWFLFGHILWDAYLRSKTRYALSNKRAFIARQVFGRRLKSYPIDPDTELDYRPGEPATIYFAKRMVKRRVGARSGSSSSTGLSRYRMVPIGFRYIPDGDKVYQLMRRAQRGEA